MQLRSAILALVLAVSALSPAHATAEYTFAKGEYGIVDGGRAPSGRLSIAVHGEGEGGRNKFHAYLMAEPGHRRLAVLDDISENNNLDTKPDAYYARWSPDSRYVAVSFRSERHIMTMNIYRVEGGRARLIGTPDLFRDITGRTIDRKTDGDMRTYGPSVEWRAPRRFRFNDYRLFVLEDTKLADKLGALGKTTTMKDGRYTIQFSADADVTLVRGDRLRVGKPRPGTFPELE
ncbi:hypothetical protein [Bradyrhizobium liaoningense]|uniref:hypothetical protein n=1 Tax=Bradyrhizobium liaoningense TaxID=43992 RepID=UPI001BA55594|nr:hypothetical protein [Bradyrhizobium liaoningense]MBR0717360.1 hypothetical protein [Bradyrhizobium liaoningense]